MREEHVASARAADDWLRVQAVEITSKSASPLLPENTTLRPVGATAKCTPGWATLGPSMIKDVATSGRGCSDTWGRVTTITAARPTNAADAAAHAIHRHGDICEVPERPV